MSMYTPREACERSLKALEKAEADHAAGRITVGQLNAAANDLSLKTAALKAAQAKYTPDAFQQALKAGTFGDGSMLSTSGNTGPTGLAGAVMDAGFDLKSVPSVTMPGGSVFKASTFPASTALSSIQPSGVTPYGKDSRFLWPSLPSEDVGSNTAVEDFKQTARAVTGDVERAVDATTTKASLDVTITAAVQAIKQFAITIDSIPNIVLESSSQMASFLSGEGQFQVNKALDDHVLDQIVAATPAFGNTGTTTIDKVRNAIAAMHALGANPDVLVINPGDLAALDLFRVGGSTTTDGPYAIDTTRGASTPLWGLRIVERIGGGSDPMYLIDTNMLGHLYLGRVRVEADPFTEFKKNLTTLRVEMNALYHIRNIQGARRIAAA